MNAIVVNLIFFFEVLAARLLSFVPRDLFWFLVKKLMRAKIEMGKVDIWTQFQRISGELAKKGIFGKDAEQTMFMLVGCQASGKTLLSHVLSRSHTAAHVDFNDLRAECQRKGDQASGVYNSLRVVQLLVINGFSVVCDVSADRFATRVLLRAILYKFGHSKRKDVQIFQNKTSWDKVSQNIKTGTPHRWYFLLGLNLPSVNLTPIENAKEWWWDEAVRCRDKFFSPDGSMKALPIRGLQVVSADNYMREVRLLTPDEINGLGVR